MRYQKSQLGGSGAYTGILWNFNKTIFIGNAHYNGFRLSKSLAYAAPGHLKLGFQVATRSCMQLPWYRNYKLPGMTKSTSMSHWGQRVGPDVQRQAGNSPCETWRSESADEDDTGIALHKMCASSRKESTSWVSSTRILIYCTISISRRIAPPDRLIHPLWADCPYHAWYLLSAVPKAVLSRLDQDWQI